MFAKRAARRRETRRIELADAAVFAQQCRSWRGCEGRRFQAGRSYKLPIFVGAAGEQERLEPGTVLTDNH
jgi:hypothetical protein